MKQSNFELLDLKIGMSVYDAQTNETGIIVQPFNANQLMELHYYEDITKANVLLVLKLNDSSSGLLGGLMGMEPMDISWNCLLYTSPSPRDISGSRMPSSA